MRFAARCPSRWTRTKRFFCITSPRTALNSTLALACNFRMSVPVQADEDSTESFEQIVRSYEETLSLANITAASSIERLGSIRDEVDLLKGSWEHGGWYSLIRESDAQTFS